MSGRKFPTDILTQAIEVQAGWSEIDEGMTFGPLNIGSLVMDVTHIRTIEGSLATLEAQLTELRDQRDALCEAAWDKVKRARAGVKAAFGDDSTQYNIIGGTRVSDRKPMRKSPLPVEQP
jgi:hypothetical protein